MRTEKEKMLAGEHYNAGDSELIARWHKAKQLMRAYNQTETTDQDELNRILDELLGSRGKSVWITAPFFVDYGDNTTIGAGSVVTKSIPANCLAVGNPCKVMRML